jgi:hypothetical protein
MSNRHTDSLVATLSIAKQTFVIRSEAVAERCKPIDMWRRAGRGGTHGAKVAAVDVEAMAFFMLTAVSTGTITVPIEHLCDDNAMVNHLQEKNDSDATTATLMHEHSKTIDMWRRAGRGGTHVAVLEAAGASEMVSFSFVALSTLAIAAPIERLCDNNE